MSDEVKIFPIKIGETPTHAGKKLALVHKGDGESTLVLVEEKKSARPTAAE